MIKMENIGDNVIRITVPETLKGNDFKELSSQVEEAVKQYGKIRLLVDASNFNGWDNIEAFEKHMGFVKSHHNKVERIALIAGHMWQHWFAAFFKIFVHPEIQIFYKDEENEAIKWIKEE